MDFSNLTDEQLESTYKQAELHPENALLLKAMRFEMYKRGFSHFHGIHFEQLLVTNQALAEEYEAWRLDQLSKTLNKKEG